MKQKRRKLPGGRLSVLLLSLLLILCLMTGCQSTEQKDPAKSADKTTAADAEDTAGGTLKDNTPADAEGGILKDNTPADTEEDIPKDNTAPGIDEDAEYTDKDSVALYIYTYGHLPSNFITKKEAKKLGWVSREGNLNEVAPGKSIGGDHFGNYEEQLPVVKGRNYSECDIDADGGYRGAKRIIYSDDGLVYYTEDHYNSFELLYGEE